MKKTVACVIARTVSARLPLKILRNINEEYRIIDFIIQRLKLVKNIDEIYICTSHEEVDEILEDVSKSNKVKIYRGSPDIVIERMLAVGKLEEADNVIRITGDNVFTSYEYLEDQIKIHNENNLDYTRIINIPIGGTAEIMRLSAVKECYDLIDPAISEYLMLYMFKPEHFRCGVITLSEIEESSSYTVSIDTNEDLNRTREVLRLFKGKSLTITLKDILKIMKDHNLPNSIIAGNGVVKMPYGEEIPFPKFQEDMQNRILNSYQFTIG